MDSELDSQQLKQCKSNPGISWMNTDCDINLNHPDMSFPNTSAIDIILNQESIKGEETHLCGY